VRDRDLEQVDAIEPHTSISSSIVEAWWPRIRGAESAAAPLPLSVSRFTNTTRYANREEGDR
jgi:hypothetical protein